MLESLASYKAGLLVLAGIASAPLLQPLVKRVVTLTVRVTDTVKNISDGAAGELRAITAEAVAERAAASEPPGLSPAV